MVLWLTTTAVFAVAHLAGPAAGAAALAALLLVFLVLWLDALLFRLFGVELEPAAVRKYCGEILDGLADEAKQVARFLPRSYFSLLPLVAAAALSAAHRSELAGFLLAPLLLYFGFRASSLVGPKRAPVGLAAALLACLLARGSPPTGEVLVVAVLLALGAKLLASTSWAASKPFFDLPTYLRPFVPGRAIADDSGSPVREEHAHLFRRPAAARRSGLHGRLRGVSVVLVTLEGVARDHLALFQEGGAATPFLERLAARSVVSRHHFCVSPQTTNSHRAIYAAGYPDVEGFPCLDALRRAGYRTVYLTPANTRHFGLGDLIRRAGFDPVLDQSAFVPHAREPDRVSDYVLMDQGARIVRELAERPDPFFVHVQTKNTHKSYRVVDPGRFNRWQGRGEISRYRNCLEEMDWILGEFLTGLRESLDDTLLVVTADHGQAFGEFGYHGHSSSVIKEEVNVPFLMTHPRIEPASVDFSSHFDVLPTVLDLLGIPCPDPVFGEPLLLAGRTPSLLLYSEVVRSGVPTSCGLIDDGRKVMVDLILGKTYEMDWDDRVARELAGGERAYFSALLRRLLAARGLLRG